MSSQQFLGYLSGALRDRLSATVGLSHWLDSEIEGAESAWPGVSVPRDRFLRYLAEHFPGDVDPERLFAEWRLDDLYLCCACATGDGDALGAFEQRYKRVIDSALARQRLQEPLLGEAKQALRVMLFVGDTETPPSITQYSGPGQLGSWLWVVATRNARRLLGKEKRLVPVQTDEIGARLIDAAELPPAEFALSQESYREAFKRAFRRAMESLSDQQLALVRYRYVDGLGIQEIGQIYRVHHSTVSRRVEQVRRALQERTQAALMEELDLSADACASIIGLFRRDFDVSITTLLGRPLE